MTHTTAQEHDAPSEETPEMAVFHDPEFIERPGVAATGEEPAPEEMRLFDYERYGRLAGPLTEPEWEDAPIRYRRPHADHPRRALTWTLLVLAIQSAFVVWLLQTSHLPVLAHSPFLAAASITMIASIYLIELFRFVNVTSLCFASALALDPVPMTAPAGRRVAFLTTIVPSREPLAIVEKTLEAARRIRYAGVFDVWLLDEEDDPVVRETCAGLGVRHFSRSGIERFNRPSGAFKARSKHGNYNSWVDAHGDDYDFFVSVDPDHVPLACYCERILGYFRDPDVAFAVGPQVYGNWDNFVTKGAESQQFVFHGLIQRMGNRFRAPMLVGTNNAVRISALREVGGLRDSITEDLATSLTFHSARNPVTGCHWRSVYTPDVLAVGEGPTNFTDFFTQQHRWARGTFENFRGHLWRSLRGLSPGARLHYSLITSYYPSAAIGWVLGAVNCVIYLVLGARGLQVRPQIWLAVYVDLAAVQFCLYAANRRLNVSPHERPGSSGAVGMFMSVLAAPIYVGAFVKTVLGRRGGFVVTPKGVYRSSDSVRTFRAHLGWGALMGGAFLVSLWLDRPESSMRWWSLILIGVCLIPWAIAAHENRRLRALDGVITPTVEIGPAVGERHPSSPRGLSARTEAA